MTSDILCAYHTRPEKLVLLQFTQRVFAGTIHGQVNYECLVNMTWPTSLLMSSCLVDRSIIFIMRFIGCSQCSTTGFMELKISFNLSKRISEPDKTWIHFCLSIIMGLYRYNSRIILTISYRPIWSTSVIP